MSEHEVQATVVQYIQSCYPGVLFHSIPNGARLASGKDNRIAIMRMNILKQEGLLPGVCDLFLAEARGYFNGFYLELKTDKGKLSENQEWFIAHAEKKGYYTAVCFGVDEAIEMIDQYMGWPETSSK